MSALAQNEIDDNNMPSSKALLLVFTRILLIMVTVDRRQINDVPTPWWRWMSQY
jgi:hypothetical protein